MVGVRWRRLFRISAYAGLFTGALGIAFLLYLLLAAQDDMSDLCDMTEVGQGLLPFGNEGGCNPRWLVWLLAFIVSAAFGALPILLIGTILLLAAAHGDRRHISE